MTKSILAATLGSLLAFTFSQGAKATYAIVACEATSGHCGVAVATHNLAVGDGVPFVRAGVGAGVSQFETNPCHGPAALEALAAGRSAAAALGNALAAQTGCPDGLGDAERQVGVVSVREAALDSPGPASKRADYSSSVAQGAYAAVFTGANASASATAGHRLDDAHPVLVVGNGLAAERVLDAMWEAFHDAQGPLAHRLLLALEAGHAAGGQRIGVLSAALRVATPQGWPVDVDLRVDFAHGTAVTDLRRAYNAYRARQLMVAAERAKPADRAKTLAAKALALAPDWDRIWLRGARLAKALDQAEEAERRACRFGELNPGWAGALARDGTLAACAASP